MLKSYSAPLLPLIEWRPTPDGNVEVLNDTTDFYRYFDATRHAEFLYACVEQVIERDMPDEIRFLKSFDAFSEAHPANRGHAPEPRSTAARLSRAE